MVFRHWQTCALPTAREPLLDSLTQLLLGACVGAACAPAARRRRGALYGALLGTLPDLDVLLPAPDPVTAMVTHRGFSHSLLLLTALAPLLYLACARLDPALRTEPQRWRLGFWLALLTHPLLDWCTTYGTQLLWPLDRTPHALDSVFIIDPLYTLPLLLATVLVLAGVRPARQGQWLRWALAGSSAYLLWGLALHAWVLQRARAAVAELGLPAASVVHVAPAPLTTLLWRVVLVDPAGGWHEGWHAPLAETRVAGLLRHAGLPLPAAELPDLRRLAAFSGGVFALREHAGRLWYADLRMGAEPWFVFRFALAERDANGHWQPLQPALQAALARPPLRTLGWLLRRSADPALVAPPEAAGAPPWP